MGGPSPPGRGPRAAGARVRLQVSANLETLTRRASRVDLSQREKGISPVAIHSHQSIRCKHFVHACAKLRTPLFEFVDALAILAAAEIIG